MWDSGVYEIAMLGATLMSQLRFFSRSNKEMDTKFKSIIATQLSKKI